MCLIDAQVVTTSVNTMNTFLTINTGKFPSDIFVTAVQTPNFNIKLNVLNR